MEGLVFGFVAIAFFGSQIYRGVHRRRRRTEAWREAARRAGLTHISGDTPSLDSTSITGRAGTRLVRLETRQRSGRGERRHTLIRVGGDSRVTLRAESLGTALEKAVGMGELQIGDEAFDRAVYVQGRPEILRAVLDAETRSTLQGLIRGLRPGRVSVLDGDVCAELDDEVVEAHPALLASFLEELLDIAQRMDRPTEVAVRIADNTRREPEWRVRLENILLLVEKFPAHFASREALEQARSDEHPEVRLRAALASGEDGIPTLLEMASLRSAEDAYGARAIQALGDRFPPQSAEEVLGRALRSRQVQTALACLDRLGRAGPPVIALLEKVLAVEEGELAVAAAWALGATGATAAEAPLLRALARTPGDVVAAAAQALGGVGSTAAVLPLKEAAAREGADGRLRRAARQAVAEIQSRLPGASPGQVSLAEGEAGQLSLAGEDPMGRVTLADQRSEPRPGEPGR